MLLQGLLLSFCPFPSLSSTRASRLLAPPRSSATLALLAEETLHFGDSSKRLVNISLFEPTFPELTTHGRDEMEEASEEDPMELLLLIVRNLLFFGHLTDDLLGRVKNDAR